MKPDKRRKRLAVLLLLLIAIAVIASLVLWAIARETVPGLRSVDIYLTVGNYTGLNVRADALYFGTLVPGTSATRFVSVTNEFNSTLDVRLWFDGSVAAFISAPESLQLGPYGNTTIEVMAAVPQDAQSGEYNGKLFVQSTPAP